MSVSGLEVAAARVDSSEEEGQIVDEDEDKEESSAALPEHSLQANK